MTDRDLMRRALALAAQADNQTLPNPMVGAVVVRDGTIVGEGFHQQAGKPHAERNALELAGERAQGATLYVTLEPCNHQGRTPPCTEAILASGIARVVVASRDPNPHVCGGGIEYLRGQGVEVEVGLCADEEEKLNTRWRALLSQG